jgi:ribonuclease-3
MIVDFKNLEQILGYQFKNQKLLEQAFLHASAIEGVSHQSYERMEFLGDRILGLVVADLIYHSFPFELEGDLAKRLSFLVSAPLLAQVAENLELDQYVTSALPTHFSKAEKKESILADVCEALIAALYLDGGLKTAWTFVESQWKPLLERIPEPPRDPKSQLQEWLQGHLKKLPKYKLVEKTGPDHNPFFKVELTIEPYGTVLGQGPSMRKAEKEAAAEMLKKVLPHD